jgi:type II secretory pathway pseudopilin PulG
MMDRKNIGFTIIELMLVLAISGALVVAILVGSSAAINQQRYRDSVSSLKSFIQNQYDKVSNTLNDRAGTEGCTATAAIITAPGQAQARGTSDCVILGRLVTIAANGVDLTAVDVVGYPIGITPSGVTDIVELQTYYKLGVSATSTDSDVVAWGAKVIKPKTPSTPQPLAMLIIRSPQSGSIMTFTAPGGVPSGGVGALVSGLNNTANRDLCVNPSGFSTIKRMEVQVPAMATNQTDIQIPTESTSVCN